MKISRLLMLLIMIIIKKEFYRNICNLYNKKNQKFLKLNIMKNKNKEKNKRYKKEMLEKERKRENGLKNIRKNL